MILIGNNIVIDWITRGSKIDRAKNSENKAKLSSEKNRKMTKFKILIKPKNHDFSFKLIKS